MKLLIAILVSIIMLASCKKSVPIEPICYIGIDISGNIVKDTIPVSTTPSNPNGYILRTQKYCTTQSLDYVNSHKSEWQTSFPKVNSFIKI